MRLLNQHGGEVAIGDMLFDCHGRRAIVVKLDPPIKKDYGGHVYVKWVTSGQELRYFVTVFGCRYEE